MAAALAFRLSSPALLAAEPQPHRPMCASDRISDPRPAQPNAWLDAGLYAVWLLGVALAPVWFGANEPLVWGAHAALFGLLLAAYTASMLAAGGPLPVPLRRLHLPLLAIGVVEGWAAIQTVAWVPGAWKHPVWTMVRTLLGDDVPGAISVYPAAGRTAMLWLATAAAVFFLAVQWGRSPGRARLILQVLATAGGAITAYGLVVYFRGNDWVLWRPKHAYYDALTATFVNRNTYAAYAGATMVCAFGLCLDSLLDRGAPAMTAIRRAGRLAVPGSALLTAGAGLLLTGSRAGLAVTAIGLAVVLALGLPRPASGRTALSAVSVAASALALVVLLTGVGAVTRLPLLATAMAERLAVYERVLAAIEASPWLGYGFGAFEQAFPMFRDDSISPHGIWEYAHNDWLEALMTLGVPAGSLLCAVFGWILVRCVVGALRRVQDWVYPAIGAGVCSLAALHSLVDFSMQIQGFAIPVMAILGVAVAQSWSRGAAADDPSADERLPRGTTLSRAGPSSGGDRLALGRGRG
jgi:O-antigen ligase